MADRLLRPSIGSPLTVELQLTDRCTHRCPWCIYDRASTDLSLTIAKAAISDAAALGASSLIVSGGGEPLLHAYASEILAAARAAGLHVCLLTNGELLSPMHDVVLACCDFVRVSLDAGRPKTYSRLHGVGEERWHEVWAGISGIASHAGGPLIGISYVATPNNCDELGQLAVVAASSGVKYLLVKHDVRRKHATLENLRHRMTPHLEEAARLLDVEYRRADADVPQPELPVALAAARPTVAASGRLYPCCHLTTPEFEIADLSVTALVDIWATARHREVTNLARRRTHSCRSYRHLEALSELRSSCVNRVEGSPGEPVFF